MTATLSDETKLEWLQLIRSDNVGPRTFAALISRFGGAGRALQSLPELARRGGASRPARICSRQDAERELAALTAAGGTMIAVGEPDYPIRLQMIDDPPPLITVRGNRAAL